MSDGDHTHTTTRSNGGRDESHTGGRRVRLQTVPVRLTAVPDTPIPLLESMTTAQLIERVCGAVSGLRAEIAAMNRRVSLLENGWTAPGRHLHLLGHGDVMAPELCAPAPVTVLPTASS